MNESDKLLSGYKRGKVPLSLFGNGSLEEENKLLKFRWEQHFWMRPKVPPLDQDPASMGANRMPLGSPQRQEPSLLLFSFVDLSNPLLKAICIWWPNLLVAYSVNEL